MLIKFADVQLSFVEVIFMRILAIVFSISDVTPEGNKPPHMSVTTLDPQMRIFRGHRKRSACLSQRFWKTEREVLFLRPKSDEKQLWVSFIDIGEEYHKKDEKSFRYCGREKEFPAIDTNCYSVQSPRLLGLNPADVLQRYPLPTKYIVPYLT